MTTQARPQRQMDKRKDGAHNGSPLLLASRSEAGLRVSEAKYWSRYYEHPEFRFVLPEYQVEKQRAERMAATLRKLGVNDADL